VEQQKAMTEELQVTEMKVRKFLFIQIHIWALQDAIRLKLEQ
jgi:hypothetical protein